MMNSIERVRAAIDLRQPDRVPVDLHNFQPAAAAMGVSMAQVFQDGELLAEAMLKAWRKFGHDMILLENGTACNAQACGVQVIYRDDAAPAAHIPVITRLEDLDKLQVPDPYSAFPMCEIIKATRILSREIGDRVWICGRADQGPMDLASQLFGMEPLMLEIATGEKADLVHRLLDYARGSRRAMLRADRKRRTFDLHRRAGGWAGCHVAPPLPQVRAAAGETDGG